MYMSFARSLSYAQFKSNMFLETPKRQNNKTAETKWFYFISAPTSLHENTYNVQYTQYPHTYSFPLACLCL